VRQAACGRQGKLLCYTLHACSVLLVWGLLHGWTPALAHHGGLGIEGDLVQWALKVDQWQEEVIEQGYRIKFLSYPRQPVLGDRTRLVFEIQSVATGRYVSGLTAELRVYAPDGTQHSMPLPETTGVTAYYEAAVAFEQLGAHRVMFRASTAGVPFEGTFHKVVRRSMLFGDWAIFVGNIAVLAAFAVTWLGLVLSIQRRFVAPGLTSAGDLRW
jgi:hypothetical protein